MLPNDLQPRIRRTGLLLVFLGFRAWAQPPVATDAPPPPPDPERWNIFYQATSIGDYHGTFTSPYEGPFSLQDRQERDVSLTTTLFFTLRLDQNSFLSFDPEIAGGRGFSGVNGLANPANGELPRVASATPKPYLARLYISHDFGFGDEKEPSDSDENQLAGERPMNRYTISAGRFSLTDFFDDNKYSHDPRSQFMGWAVMYNGAWDYPADTRGYTWGWVHELHLKNWSFRYASAAMPKIANGQQLDRRVFVNRGDVWEAERRYEVKKHAGTIRALPYMNHADMGTYAAAIRLAQQTGGVPDIIATRRNGTLKYGFGLNWEQEITKDVGIFSRLGWNDGKTESFAFTAIDRLATGGISLTGTRWRRRFDTVATEFTASGISGVHAQYLALGGHDFLIGDGRLEYGPECIWESYYSARLFPGFFASFDLQHVNNPAYNQQRGPVWIESLRFHIEVGKNTFKH
ncbi:MAG TPA: carbohydrate porin [Bryobacteraceae bacterium]|jgi:high affinity Mn2+ porin|nr:carbohydrate porin [Bryobacteraceae bacterium]